MYYAYIIQNPKGLLYKGSWKCVYKETFKTRKEAEVRERFFKTGKGREFIKSKLDNKNTAE